MTEWHERLIRLRDEEKTLLSVNFIHSVYQWGFFSFFNIIRFYYFQTIKDDEDQVENLEKRNAILEKDVARYREREVILNRVNINDILVITNFIMINI